MNHLLKIIFDFLEKSKETIELFEKYNPTKDEFIELIKDLLYTYISQKDINEIIHKNKKIINQKYILYSKLKNKNE